MRGFLDIKEIILPAVNIEALYKHLREVGSHGMEGIGLFLGQAGQGTFKITTTVIPSQKTYRTESGLMYHVEGEELHQINVWAYKNKLSLIAQIHSHPQEAYHSEMDDAYSIVTALGGFSIVIPNFGFGPIDVNLWAVYRLLPEQGWKYISPEDSKKLFQII